MSHELTVVWVVLVGAQLSVQAPINNGLGRTIGKLPAAMVSFLVGLLLLLTIGAVGGSLGGFSSIGDASWTMLVGGLIGATYVGAATVTIAKIGAGAVAAATIVGQLVSSLVIDQFGWVGVDQIPVTGLRLFGVLLLLGGTALVVYRKQYADDVEGAGKAGLVAVAAMVTAGAAVGFQHPLNSELAGHIGDINAAILNFATGTVLLVAIVFAGGLGGGLRHLGEVRWYYFLGGMIGLITVITALVAVGTIGAAGLTAAIVTGQLLASVALDRFGAFGLQRRKATLARLAGVALLVAGTFMTVY